MDRADTQSAVRMLEARGYAVERLVTEPDGRLLFRIEMDLLAYEDEVHSLAMGFQTVEELAAKKDAMSHLRASCCGALG